MSQIENYYRDNPNVLIFTNLDDLDDNTIYHTCEEWGDRGVDFGSMPLITGDIPNNNLWGSFNSNSAYPSTVYIDHSMTVHYKANNPNLGTATSQINQMLDKLYNALLISAYFDISFNNDVDGDGLMNPGDSFDLNIVVMNKSFEADNIAENVNVQLTSSGTGITINTSDLGDIGNIEPNSYYEINANVQIAEDITINDYFLTLDVTTENFDDDDNLVVAQFGTDFSVTLNQVGFPVDVSGELISSSALIDLDNDNQFEIVSSDKGGFIHIFEIDGSEWDTDLFPYYTGSENWGSPAVSDLDGDGYDEVVVSSKTGHIYIFDHSGLKLDYNSGGYITATPALGDIDGDGLDEIVFGQYANPKLLYALNVDGSSVDGFPYDIDEKVQRGAALCDFNGNGRDDIVVGTDDEFIHLILDDGTLSWSYETGGDIRVEPTVLELNTGEKIVLVGSKDDNFYALNSDGSLRFMIETDDEITTEASIVDVEDVGPIIFFSSDEMVYAVDTDGQAYGSWPMDIGQELAASIVFSTLDGADVDCGRCPSDPEVIFGDLSTDLHAYRLDGTPYDNFPISAEFPFKGTPIIMDLDDDADLEIIIGSTQTLDIIDVKDPGENAGYWNTFRSDKTRDGHYISNMGVLSIEDENVIEGFSISSVYPNPFNPTVTVEYELAYSGDVSINIFDIYGNLVQPLYDSYTSAGYNSIIWNAQEHASGMYIISIESSGTSKTEKLMLLK